MLFSALVPASRRAKEVIGGEKIDEGIPEGYGDRKNTMTQS